MHKQLGPYLIDEVLKISAGKASCSPCNNDRIDSYYDVLQFVDPMMLTEPLTDVRENVSHVMDQDLCTSFDIGERHDDLLIETTGPNEGSVGS